MGKYLKKSKPTTADVSSLPSSSSSSSSRVLSMGVRTSAKTLALQRLPDPDPNPDLHLRNRSLHKTNTPTLIKSQSHHHEADLDFHDRDRSTRESTPCSLIGGSGSVTIPGSINRRRSSVSSGQIPSDFLTSIPSTQEIEEFFATAEEQQRKSFVEKYNFDILNDTPLPGRYEWVEVTP